MALFTKALAPKEKNMISDGIILVPSVLSSEETTTFSPKNNNLSISQNASKSVTATPATTKIPGRNISFVDNYKNWTMSPILNEIYKNDIKIPIIHLKEYKLYSSTIWEQAKYFAYIFGTRAGTSAETLQTLLGEENSISKILEKTQDILDSRYSGANKVLEFLQFDTPDFTTQKSDDPYEGLYKKTETGFQYTLPFYSQNIRSKNTNFSEGYSGDGRGTKIPSIIQDKVVGWSSATASGIRPLIEPGIYIEKTQYYNFGNLENVSFSFPLLNTESQNQINENYQFLFLLIYQNSLFRKDRAAYIPPSIYEVLIPGIRYMKFAYISDLSVDFLGTRRMVEVDSGLGTFKTIVPEAYNVSLTIQGMHEENGNFLIKSATNNIGDV